MPMRRGSCSRPGPRSTAGFLSSASGICGQSWPSTRPTTTDVVPIAAANSARPRQTTLPLTSPMSGSNVAPSVAASSPDTSEPPKSPGQGRWRSSRTPQAVSSAAAIYVLHDQQGTPLGMVRGGTSYAFVTDNIGSVTAIVDSSGSTDATYTYGPYGPVLSDNGSLAPANLLSYTGALTDISSGNATGYTHNGNRWYDTATGAFTTQDTSTYLANPANGNRYAYAADNPANYIDPTGQGSWASALFAGVGSVLGGLFCGGLALGLTANTGIGLLVGVACGAALAVVLTKIGP